MTDLDLRCWHLMPVLGGTFVGCQRPTGHDGPHAHTEGPMSVVEIRKDCK